VTRAFTASRAQLAQLRLSAQGLGSPGFDRPAEVVRHLLAMQARSFDNAKWAIGLRTSGAKDSDVEAALAAGEIVRSWPMRGTLHFTPAEDLGWMLGLTAARTVQSASGRHRALGLDDEAFALASRLAETAVGEAGVLGRSDLLEALNTGGLSTEGQRGAHVLLYLCVTGLLVHGPPAGKQQTFALLGEWVRSARALDGDEALAEFARRYFLGHGPASDRDFAWWSSLTLTQARRGLAMVAHELQSLTVEGVEYWHRPGLEPAPPGVAALPGFDEYVLGYQTRTAQLTAEWFLCIVPGGNGMFLPTIVVNGEIVGTWKRTGVIDEFAPLSAAHRRELERQLQRHADFVRLP